MKSTFRGPWIGPLESEPLKFVTSTSVALRMFIMQVPASQLHFLSNRNNDLTITMASQLHKKGGHAQLLSVPTVHTLCCAFACQ